MIIDNEQLPKGYKQTEVGVIPEDWELKTIGDIGSVGSGGTPSRVNQSYWNGTIPWITTTQIDFNTINSAEQFITKEGLNNSAAKLFPPGTLLMAMYGQGKTRGKVAILGVEASTNQACAAILLDRTVHQNYVFHYLVNQYEAIRTLSNTGNQENLNGLIIKSIKIPFPPSEEQRSIAQALSDVDALIAALDKAIAKKRAIKTATMQQLLTGKKRLPGFGEGKGYQQTEVGVIPEDWEVKAVGEVCDFIVPGRNKPRTFKGDIPWITTPDLEDGRSVSKSKIGLFVSRDEAKNVGSRIVPTGSVLMSCVGELGIVALVEREIVINQQLHAFIPSKMVNSIFLLNALQAQKEYMLSIATITAVPYLNKDNCNSIPIPLPKFLEQRAIATVFSDMDAEIAALETRLAKTQALKQGMMQALLTGRVRLV